MLAPVGRRREDGCPGRVRQTTRAAGLLPLGRLESAQPAGAWIAGSGPIHHYTQEAAGDDDAGCSGDVLLRSRGSGRSGINALAGRRRDLLPGARRSALKKKGVTMLVLTRKENEAIRIGDNIMIIVCRIDHDKVRIAVEAPNHVRILRAELEE